MSNQRLIYCITCIDIEALFSVAYVTFSEILGLMELNFEFWIFTFSNA